MILLRNVLGEAVAEVVARGPAVRGFTDEGEPIFGNIMRHILGNIIHISTLGALA
jgi:hypothetical protein